MKNIFLQHIGDSQVSFTLVCRHNPGYWNAVSADQFGEQTAIKIGKGGLKGMTLAAELVSEWIDAFPITARVSDAHDQDLIYAKMEKHPHPLEDVHPIYTILSLVKLHLLK